MNLADWQLADLSRIPALAPQSKDSKVKLELETHIFSWGRQNGLARRVGSRNGATERCGSRNGAADPGGVFFGSIVAIHLNVR